MAATIKIYNVETSTVRYTALAEEESKRVFSLMEDDYILLVFKTKQEVYFELGDYIIHDTYGRFEITTPQTPTYNTTTGAYEYSLQFDAPYMKWANKKFRYNPSDDRFETSFSLTSDIKTHMSVLVDNIAYHGFKFSNKAYEYYGEVQGGDDDVISTMQYITFDNVSILEALDKIAEAFEVEWWVIDNIIHLGRVEYGKEGEVEFKLNDNVASITSYDSQGDSYFNTFIAFGAETNLPYNYRKSEDSVTYGVVQKRLMLPTAHPVIYVGDITADSPEERKVEGVVVFDDIYPKTNGTISEVISFTEQVEVEDDTTTDETTYEEVTFFRFKDSSLTFSEDYILDDDLQITFSSGNLAGMTFGVKFNPLGVSSSHEDYQMFEIVRNEDYGIYLPSENYAPAVGDEYTLIGFDATAMTDMGLIDAAEEELYQRALKYAEKLQIDPNNYECTMMADYMYGRNESDELDKNYAKTFDVGDVVTLIDANMLGGSRTSRVIGFEYRLDEPYNEAKIIIGENTTYSRSSALEGEISAEFDEINFGTSEASVKKGGNNIYIITTNDSTAEKNTNVYSALRTKQSFARKTANDTISALWTFAKSVSERGIQTAEYNNEGNEDNLFGKGFTLKNVNGVSKLEVDNLLVRMGAVFASVEIRTISYLGGNYIFSAAGSKIYHVVEKDTFYRCYLYSDDGTTATENLWEVDDQALCETFNIEEGTHTDVSNKRYWRLVVGTGKEVISGKTILDDNGEETADTTQYQYVDLSKIECESGSDIPEADDAIVHFGNWTNTDRQGAIYLMVTGDIAPALIEYANVGTSHFVWPTASTQISPKGGNIFTGKFYSVVEGVTNSSTIEEQISEVKSSNETLLNQADDKMSVWFNGGTPYPLESDLETFNSPAEDWTTDDAKELHLGDLYYDTQKDAGTTGGRAWKWVLVDGNYYWDDITDADTLAALEMAAAIQLQVDNLADDGVISAGTEKSQLLVTWNDIYTTYTAEKNKAEQYGLEGEYNWAMYKYFLARLGVMLDGGDPDGVTQGSEPTLPETPAWIGTYFEEDTVLSECSYITTAEQYRSIWYYYYKNYSDWLVFSEDYINGRITNLKTVVDNIANDGVITGGQEKSELYLAWQDALSDYETNLAQATLRECTTENADGYTEWNEYVTALTELGALLNGGTALTNLTDTPSWLSDLTADTTIDASTYRTTWQTYYSKLSAWLQYWQTAVSQDATNALSQIENIVSDNIISSSEKRDLYLLWKQEVENYNAYKSHADARSLTEEDVWIDYVNALLAVGKKLNDGIDITESGLGSNLTWFNNMDDSVTMTDAEKTAYLTAWDTYYACASDWVEYWGNLINEATVNLEESVNDIVSDSIIKGGAEKSQLYLAWAEASELYKSNLVQAEDSGMTGDSEWVAYDGIFFTLATMLNGGNAYNITTLNAGTIPLWIDSDNISTDTTIDDVTTYRSTWESYYASLNAWQEYWQLTIYVTTDELKIQVNAISDDGIITPSEKSTLLVAWRAAASAYKENSERAEKFGLADATAYTDYVVAIDEVATMLDNGDMADVNANIEAKFYTPHEFAWFADMTTSIKLSETSIGDTSDETVGIAEYKSLWQTFYDCLHAWSVLWVATEQAMREDIDAIADDGILSGGTEKSQLYIAWKEAVSEYNSQYEKFSTLNASSDAFTEYQTALLELCTMLNGGTAVTTATLSDTPSWLEDLTTDITIDADTYRSTWNTYYEKLSAWKETWDNRVGTLATSAFVTVSEIASDGVIAGGAEKQSLFNSWNDVVTEYKEGLSYAKQYALTTSTAWTAFDTAVFALGTILNDGTTYSDIDATPSWLQDLTTSTSITSTTSYYNAWSTYYSTLATWKSTLSEIDTSALKLQTLGQLGLAYQSAYGDKASNSPIIYLDGGGDTTEGSIVYGESTVQAVLSDGGYEDVPDSLSEAFLAAQSILGSVQVHITAAQTVADDDDDVYYVALETASNYYDTFSGSITTSAPCTIYVYLNDVWQVAHESVLGVIENLGTQLRVLLEYSDGVSGLVTKVGQNTLFTAKWGTDSDGNYTYNGTAIITTANFASMAASYVDNNGIVKEAQIQAFISKQVDDDGNVVTDDDGNTYIESGVIISADNIILEGLVTANENFQVLGDGSIIAKNATISGTVTATAGEIGGFTINSDSMTLGSDAFNVTFQATTSSKVLTVNGSPSSYSLGNYTFSYSNNRKVTLASSTSTYNWRNIFIADVFDVAYYSDTSTSGTPNNSYGYQYAGLGSGHFISDGIIDGTCLDVLTSVFEESNQYIVLQVPLFCNRIAVSSDFSNDVVVLPDIKSVLVALGCGVINDETSRPFTLRFTIINTGTNNVYVAGYNTMTTTSSTQPFASTDTDYTTDGNVFPYLYNSSGEKITSITGYSIAAKRSIELMLVYDGTNYIAITL